jgi:hypothetical protein
MFSFFKRRPAENYDDISLDIDDTPMPIGATPTENVEAHTEEDWIAMSSAQRAIDDINAEEIRRGKPYTAEERQVLLVATAKKYVCEWSERKAMEDLINDLNESVSNQTNELDQSLQEISAKLDEPRDAVGRALKFQQEHPFLAGFLGADIIHRLKK